MLKLGITLLLGFSVAALCDDSKFSFNGKLMKPNKDYQYPPLIKIAWFNLLEGDDSEILKPWRWCGGESLIFGDEFAYTMEITQNLFDKNITIWPSYLTMYAEYFIMCLKMKCQKSNMLGENYLDIMEMIFNVDLEMIICLIRFQDQMENLLWLKDI